MDPEDTETLADLILAAVHAANENAQNLQQQKLLQRKLRKKQLKRLRKRSSPYSIIRLNSRILWGAAIY